MEDRAQRLLLGPVLLALLAGLILGYGNDGPGGGPHRRLNALALSRFIQAAAKDPILRHYDFRPTTARYGLPAASRLFQVESQTVIKSGSWYRYEPLWAGVTSTFIEEGPVRSPFAWWVEEGGYTADEPESYMAMRHFYDPLARGVDAENGLRASYLTDSLDAWISPLIMGHNPMMDAKTWAVTGSPFSYTRAMTSLDYIDALDIGDADRGKEYGAIWRSLGEILHLLADMTVPAHVRNDAHPGLWSKGNLAGDPYEDYVDADVVSRCAAGPAPDAIRAALREARDPGVLMHAVALFTNRQFFSKDTISGRDGAGARTLAPANGQAAYPAPKLEFYRFDSAGGGAGFYNTPNGLFAAAARLRDGTHTVGSPTATGQVLALIPAAVEAEVRMIDLFMPRVRVIVDGFDREAGRLHFHAVRIRADASGAYAGPGSAARPWSNPEAVVFLTTGGSARTFVAPIEAGKDEGWSLDLSAPLAAAAADAAAAERAFEASCSVGLDMGGVMVRSERSTLIEAENPEPPPAGKPPAPEKPEAGSLLTLLNRCVGVQAYVYGKFNVRGSPLQEYRNEINGGNYDWFSRQKDRYAHPLAWTGSRFAVSYSTSRPGTPTASNPNPVTTESVAISGQVSADGRTLASLSIQVTVAYDGGSQKTTIRLTNVPFESKKDELGRVEVVFRSGAAASASAEYVNTVDNDPLHYYNWTVATGDGTFDQVRIWFVS